MPEDGLSSDDYAAMADTCPCGAATLTPPAGPGCRPQSLDGR